MLIEGFVVTASYLCGSLPTGVLVGRAYGFDPRDVGSGNVGTANVARAGGKTAAILTFAGDFLKGAAPVAVATTAGYATEVVCAAALAAFLGSICSIFLRFSGGRGVSTSLGIWLWLAPAATMIALGLFLLAFSASRIVSLGSLVAAIAIPPLVALLAYPRPYLLLAIAMSALILARHQANIRRLLSGDEPAFNL